MLILYSRGRHLAPLFVSSPAGGDLDDVGMAGEDVLCLKAVDVITTGDARVLLACYPPTRRSHFRPFKRGPRYGTRG